MSTNKNLRVLVVDDMLTMRQLMRSALFALGIHNIQEAEDGEAALALLRRNNFDLVLLDAEMPRMSGMATLQSIRAAPGLTALPVVMVTSRADTDFVRHCAESGVDGYLIKPFAPAALGAHIDAALKRAERRRAELLVSEPAPA